MITASEVYWILKLDAIQGLFFTFSFFTGVFGVAMIILWGIAGSMPCRKRFFITVPIFVLLVTVTALIPSTKQMAVIKVIPAIANSEIVGELSADAKEIYRMGINAIKEQLRK